MSFTRAVHCYNGEYNMQRLFARFVCNLPRENKSADATHDDLNPRRRRRSVGLPVRALKQETAFMIIFFFCPLADTVCRLVRRVFSSSPTRFPYAQTAVKPTNRYINFNEQIIKTHRRRQPRRRSPTSDYARPVAVQCTCDWLIQQFSSRITTAYGVIVLWTAKIALGLRQWRSKDSKACQ